MNKFIKSVNKLLANLSIRSRSLEDKDETEFTFIWYKKIQTGIKTHYTQPFRTKVKAKSMEEAKDKLTRFAMAKMTLEVIEEKDLHKDELMRFQKVQKEFDLINEKFTKAIDHLFDSKFQ